MERSCGPLPAARTRLYCSRVRIPVRQGAQFGGEGGIRTLERGLPVAGFQVDQCALLRNLAAHNRNPDNHLEKGSNPCRAGVFQEVQLELQLESRCRIE